MSRPLRRLHPGAWWLWALFLAAAASRTTDLLLLALLVAVAWFMVIVRGGQGSTRTFRIYLFVALFVLVLRVAFRVLVGGDAAGDVLFRLPQISLPSWAVGIRLGGPVTTRELTGGVADGARLATLIVCVGAANALADPRRLLRSLPLALHSVGTAVVVAIGLVPQLIASALRVHRASSLRAVKSRRLRLRRTVSPVIDDALDRTLALAVAMEVRGFGRPLGPGHRRIFALTAAGLLAVATGLYLVLDGTTTAGTALVVAGMAASLAGLRFAGRRRSVTVYRPEPWLASEWVVAATGLLVLVVVLAAGRTNPAALHPIGVPSPPLPVTIAIVAAALPAWFAPREAGGPLRPTRLQTS
ncbi:MAG: energy-coupling factor transporter transmembrane protein EcfT [Acidimicrobiia bacterium]